MERLPVSTRVKVRPEPLEPAFLLEEVESPRAGAVVLFLGTARDHSNDVTGITHLEYEAYPEMVEAKIEEVVSEAIGRWDLIGVVVEHRVGMVATGEAAVAVAVSAAHRQEAFEAGRFLIDELKARAPIWKKEHWPGGGDWVKGA
ncbi:MAG TPA: molybdenum cofactor biosynthesis protein MoaE [Acidimicrobiia bacterium]|nr:molybdenum cofactor biosynthesis protein MoaE [Acidimicrobiia bacterium]